jgi:hypothetical protein
MRYPASENTEIIRLAGLVEQSHSPARGRKFGSVKQSADHLVLALSSAVSGEATRAPLIVASPAAQAVARRVYEPGKAAGPSSAAAARSAGKRRHY